MASDGFFYFGKILSTYGHKGMLTVLLDVDDPEKYKKLESVFIEIEQEQVPFFITSLELKQGKKALIQFDHVLTKEDAEPFCGRKLFLPMSMLPKLKGKKFYYHEVKGFRVTDQRLGEIGTVESILEMPVQALFQIRSGTKEILIPVADDIILRIDRRTKEIFIAAPPGLIELYL